MPTTLEARSHTPTEAAIHQWLVQARANTTILKKIENSQDLEILRQAITQDCSGERYSIEEILDELD